ncbi:GNAT superfamily N-acetyltransferase [Rubricella aquisinus]|uniref:GNAT superfamily N-acetyltransferase n=1 Tax=Rubricella aquisinus TaxID=2028108 RepID=A0A840WMW1_9RHOB|nr:GNAT family N-acetyltransferase [Rubricella aquisinus]MBB5516389.1 GNAT superfamily N-acetyltransferase [Rubricella aquisinus]
MPDITFHHVRAEDVGLLAFPSPDLFDAQINHERLKVYLDRPCHFLFVALHRGMAVGMMMGVVHYHPDVETDFVIENFYVDSRFRGRDIGRRLLATARVEAQARGCSTILFTTTTDNASARRFMQTSGFVKVPSVTYLQSVDQLDANVTEPLTPLQTAFAQKQRPSNTLRSAGQ